MNRHARSHLRDAIRADARRARAPAIISAGPTTYRVTWGRLGRDARIGGSVQHFEADGELNLGKAIALFARPYLHSPSYVVKVEHDGTFTIETTPTSIDTGGVLIAHGVWEETTHAG